VTTIVTITGIDALTATSALPERVIMTTPHESTLAARPGELPHTGGAFGALGGRSLYGLLLVFLLILSVALWDRRRLGDLGK
jgi:hypothetical protein